MVGLDKERWFSSQCLDISSKSSQSDIAVLMDFENLFVICCKRLKLDTKSEVTTYCHAILA